MEIIISKANKFFKDLCKLNTKKYRDEHGLFLIEGENLVKEAVVSGQKIKKIVVNADGLGENIGKILELISKYGLERSVVYLSGELFSKISDTVNPQGICAVLSQRIYSEEEFFKGAQTKNFVVLDGVQDPGNVGTIVRTAEAAGYAGVVCCAGSADVYAPKVVRSCAGTIFRLPILKAGAAKEMLELLKGLGKTVFCLDMDGSMDYFEAKLKKDVVLVLGNEGNGVSREAMEAADAILKIPMAGEVESLNVAIAASIVMYEKMRK